MAWLLLACPPPETPAPITVVTFNSGTSEGVLAAAPADNPYTEEHAARSDAWYGDGLAWLPAVEATRAWIAELQPDIVAFQEIFHSPECNDIPAAEHEDFVCATWSPGDPVVASYVLGPGYQVMCHPEKPDKCAAVQSTFGEFIDCDSDYCAAGMEGAPVEGCGRGARVARGFVREASGVSLTLVSVHGSSGITTDDEACRLAQVDQVFVDFGPGEPLVAGARNLVLGDLNTDPGRFVDFDDSAVRWNDFVGPDKDFRFVSEVGPDAPGSYGGLADIDHVISDYADGSCRIAGLSPGMDAVIDAVYFDHKPVVCTLREGAAEE